MMANLMVGRAPTEIKFKDISCTDEMKVDKIHNNKEDLAAT